MKRSLNLIPVATQRRQAIRRLSAVGSRAVVVCGIGVALLLGVEWARGLAATQELKSLDARFAPFAGMAREQIDLSEQIKQLHAREQLSLRLSRSEYGVTLLGSLANATARSAGSVFVQKLDYAGPAATAESHTAAQRSVRIEGAGVDSVSVGEFAENLRSSGVFDQVAVESTGPLPGGAASLRRFTIACRL